MKKVNMKNVQENGELFLPNMHRALNAVVRDLVASIGILKEFANREVERDVAAYAGGEFGSFASTLLSVLTMAGDGSDEFVEEFTRKICEDVKRRMKIVRRKQAAKKRSKAKPKPKRKTKK